MSEGNAMSSANVAEGVDREGHRTAIVFIHGQGEQKPMSSVRELARTTWSSDASLSQTDRGDLRLWSTPDTASEIFELRRLSTEGPNRGEHTSANGAKRRRFDFYEFYWAHLMAGTKFVHVILWFFTLLKKPLQETPVRLRPIRQVLSRFAELNALFAAAFSVLTSAMVLRLNVPGDLLVRAGLSDEPLSKPGLKEAYLDFQRVLGEVAAQGYMRAPMSDLSALHDTVAKLAAVGLNAAFAVVILPLIAIYFVVAGRKDAAERSNAAKMEQAPRSAFGNVITSLFALGFFYFVIGAMSPTFDLRDAVVFLAGATVFVVVFSEWRARWSVYFFYALVALTLAIFAPLPDGRVLGALTIGAFAVIWLAVRMNFVGLVITTNLVVLAAILTRTSMGSLDPGFAATFLADHPGLGLNALPDPVFSARFSDEARFFIGVSWAYFFFFSVGYGAILMNAARRWPGRLVSLFVVLLVASGLAAGAYFADAVSIERDLSVYAPWTLPFAQPVDAANATAGNLVHLQFWLTLVYFIGMIAIVVFLVIANRAFLSPVMGDSARYLRATPSNIAQRQKIREAGVSLLESLHASGRYQRIVVVGHSLGSVVGYDVLTHFWGRRVDKLGRGGEVEAAMQTLEHSARSLVTEHLAAISRATRDVERALGLHSGVKQPRAKVSDLVRVECEADARQHELRHQILNLRTERTIAALLIAAGGAKPMNGEGPTRFKPRCARLAQSLRPGPGGYDAAGRDLAVLASSIRGRSARAQLARSLFEGAARAFQGASVAHADYRRHQRAYSRLLAELQLEGGEAAWLVSDFITLGSPLNYGPYLLADTPSQFAAAKRDREALICPPFLETEPPRGFDSAEHPARLRFSYQNADPSETQTPFGPSHGSLFAPVRWTNLYFQTHSVVLGDIIAGPLWRHFDLGVHDVMVSQADTNKAFTHNEYWRSDLTTAELRALNADGLPDHLLYLRVAMDLADRGEHD